MPVQARAAAPSDASDASAEPPFALHELTAHSTPATLVAARELLLEYGRFVAAQPGVASFCLGALEREAANLPQSYLDQSGGALLATVGEHPLGFVAWRSLPRPELSAAWELKRLWTRPEARGLGIGRALTETVIERARAAGKTSLLLDTAPEAMAAAFRLYLQMGFEPCPAYNGSPVEGLAYLRMNL